MTTDAASAPETKKIPTSTITSTVEAAATGRWSSTAKSAESVSTAPALSTRSPVLRWMSIAVPPKTANHTRLTSDGTMSTPVTNCRIVRPRLMRAMNMPTNGVHDTHQAQ
jgi:hypothetical protein